MWSKQRRYQNSGPFYVQQPSFFFFFFLSSCASPGRGVRRPNWFSNQSVLDVTLVLLIINGLLIKRSETGSSEQHRWQTVNNLWMIFDAKNAYYAFSRTVQKVCGNELTVMTVKFGFIKIWSIDYSNRWKQNARYQGKTNLSCRDSWIGTA